MKLNVQYRTIHTLLFCIRALKKVFKYPIAKLIGTYLVFRYTVVLQFMKIIKRNQIINIHYYIILYYLNA